MNCEHYFCNNSMLIDLQPFTLVFQLCARLFCLFCRTIRTRVTASILYTRLQRLIGAIKNNIRSQQSAARLERACALDRKLFSYLQGERGLNKIPSMSCEAQIEPSIELLRRSPMIFLSFIHYYYYHYYYNIIQEISALDGRSPMARSNNIYIYKYDLYYQWEKKNESIYFYSKLHLRERDDCYSL